MKKLDVDVNCGKNYALNTESSKSLGEFVGNSAALKRVYEQIKQVAATSATILVSGESGVGKELVVRAIHGASMRRNRSFIKINCAAVPRDLFESEFFGHLKGSFTGAWRNRVGRFELADGGTLFLDEVTETPLELQSKLLRVLEEGTFERIGDDRTRKVDVRIIAASNRDLWRAVREGRLRADLYYRLNVFPINVPPLRERREDIEPLAAHFLRKAQESFGKAVCSLTQRDFTRLRAYEWPGNVRELRNVIERAVISAHDNKLSLGDAMPGADNGGSGRSDGRKTEGPVSDEELKRRFRENIESTLIASNWKIGGEGGAAQMLGVSPSTLRYRIKVLGITRPAASTAES